MNRNSFGVDCTVEAGDIGLLDKKKEVFDIWKETEIGEFGESLTLRIQPHETKFLIIG